MFTQSCFIRKNTEQLRDRLREIGRIYPSIYEIDNPYLQAMGGNKYPTGYIDFVNCVPKNCIDCGTNEALFLALSALRTDNDANQWFINESNEDDWILCDYGYVNDMYCYEEDKDLAEKDGYAYNPYTIKANTEQIIEHFKNK